MILLNTSYTSCSKFLSLSSKFPNGIEIPFRADALEDQLKPKQLITQRANVSQSWFPLSKIVSSPP